MVNHMFVVRTIKWLKSLVMKRWYSFISRSDTDGVLHFMNYGYEGSDPLTLNPEDEAERYSVQLYHHTADSVDLGDKDVLEVGCGRGGGISYIHRYLKPATAAGVDLNPDAIAFCRATYPGIGFHAMNAQKLDFPDESFDGVINVESSHVYPDFRAFVREVHRVLRPGGHFMISDFRPTRAVPSVEDEMHSAGFAIRLSETINDEVMAALKIDSERRVDLIRKYLPRALHGAAMEFAGPPGTKLYRSFEDGERSYFRMVLQKQERANGG
ncbi:MAG: class I SAM-dependent methyltransferase [Spirochaetota bacterium]